MYTEVYSLPVYSVVESETFKTWFAALRDPKAKARIAARIRRVSLGNLGDWKALNSGVGELRIDYGPGYRVYFTRQAGVVILLLCGGDKRTQAADIRRAVQMVRTLED